MKFAVKKILELRLLDMEGNDITEIGICCQKCGWHHSIPQWKWNKCETSSDDTKLAFCKECGELTLHKKEVFHA